MALAVVGGIWWLRGDEEKRAHPHPRVQIGVLADGFTMLAKKHVIELDREGAKQHEMPLRVDGDVRIVGTRAGTALGWQDGKKLKLATLDTDGKPDEVTTWGKKVVRLCDGAASNEVRFGVGWLESDGRVWFVHGPLARIAGEVTTSFELPVKADWCGIASAEQNVALLWREGSRLVLNFCGRKECSGLVTKVPIDTKDTLLGYGCVRDSCLFATRDKQGTTKLHRVTEKGRAIVKTLEHAMPDSPVAVVGAGTRAFAIAYVATDGRATIQRFTVDGSFSNVWHFDAVKQAPSLAWADGNLLVALQSGDVYVLKMPL